MEENYVVQNVIIESRNKLNISGVNDVISFDEETIQLSTTLGKMTVKGEDLHITGFNTDTSDLSATGKIHAVVYMSEGNSSGGFISKLFR